MTLSDEEHLRLLRSGCSDEEIHQRSPQAPARALYWRRRQLKLSLEDAAAALALEPDALERIERGEQPPDDAQLARIAALYRFDLNVLRADFAPVQESANTTATQDTPSTPAR